jgi:hypothetical protein
VQPAPLLSSSTPARHRHAQHTLSRRTGTTRQMISRAMRRLADDLYILRGFPPYAINVYVMVTCSSMPARVCDATKSRSTGGQLG